MRADLGVDPLLALGCEARPLVEAPGRRAGVAPHHRPALGHHVVQRRAQQTGADAGAAQVLGGGHAPQPPGPGPVGRPGAGLRGDDGGAHHLAPGGAGREGCGGRVLVGGEPHPVGGQAGPQHPVAQRERDGGRHPFDDDPGTGHRPTVPSAPVTSPVPVSASPDAQRAAAVADAAARWALARGVRLDPGLALWSLAGARADPGPDPAGARAGPAEALGEALEAATDGRRRRAQGLHVTPGWLAEDLVARAVDRPTSVCDPACGGGVFLVAAAERLHRAGAGREDVVRHLLWGADVDPVGLAAAEAALALWAGEAPPQGRLVLGDPLVAGPSLWPDSPPEGFGAVVGNPPFQSQLGRLTARSAAERLALRARWGPALRAYTDTAWLFLLLGCELVRPGGRVVLVQPQSLVAARDAAAVRATVAERADLADLWADHARVFAAAVRVCAPVLVRRAGRTAGGDRWGELWARALGLPEGPEPGGATLGERAVVVAGFRDEYYGLVRAVRERARATITQPWPPW